jgi:hypothetical protein
MENKTVKKIINFIENKPVKVFRHYSGRFLFGAQCIGFFGDRDECAFVAEFIKRKTGQSYRSDNLGLDMIYYFPYIADPRS